MSRVSSSPTARWKGYYYKWKAAVVDARHFCCVPDSQVQMQAGYPWDRTGFSSRSRTEAITVFSVFMTSCAVEASFSSTVTSISDPLCTVLAANLEGKKPTHQGPFITRGTKGDSIYSNRFKITFFSSIIYYRFPTAPNPKTSILPQKSINCPAPCLPQAGNFSILGTEQKKEFYFTY